MNETTKFVIIEESVIASWTKDIFTFALMVGMFYLNFRFCGGSTVFNLTIALCLFILAVGVSQRKKRTLDEAITDLATIKAKRGGK